MSVYRITAERWKRNQAKREAERKGTPILEGVTPKPSASFAHHFDQVKSVVQSYMEGKKTREFSLILPCPQSVNMNTMPDGKGGRYLTQEHRTFRQEVAFAVHQAKIEKLYGVLDVAIWVHAPRVDIDNVVKPTLDALQRAGAIENDRTVFRLMVTREHDLIPPGTISVKVREI
jgi:Holliday junction resolvase RusA-like endonuclease